MSESALRCLVISDGRRGIENQAMGLAEAAARLRSMRIATHHISHSKTFAALPATMQFAMRQTLKGYELSGVTADIAIGCGRQAIAPLRALKRKYEGTIFTVYVQDPGTDIAEFDLVVAPEHDKLSGPNVETMIGSPNRVTEEGILVDTLNFSQTLLEFPMPRAAMLIGGDSKTRRLTKAIHAKHIETARDLLEKGFSLLITPSRRTPAFALKAYQRLESDYDNVWFHEGGDNPYFAFLGGAEYIFVTEESTNMLTEACATGKPVFRLPMEGNAGKFDHLYKALEARCGVSHYDGDLDKPDYPPLRETERIAEQFWAHYDARTAVMN